MNIRHIFVTTLSVMILLNQAGAGTIQFTGAITEPACVTESAADRMQILCARNEKMRSLNFGAETIATALPWDLAVIIQTSTAKRRDIVITYR